MRIQVGWRTALAAVLAMALGACSHSAPAPSPAPAPSLVPQSPGAAPQAAGEANRELILSAAASTQEVMESLAEKFAVKTETEVKVNPGPSSGLASQILAGAPADLFLSANQKWADEVEKSGKAVRELFA